MDKKLITETATALLKTDKLGLILSAVLLVAIIVLGIMLTSKESKIEDLEYQLAMAVPETSYVYIETEKHIYNYDTVTVIKTKSDTTFYKDIFTITDTIYVEKKITEQTNPVKITFEDNSNDWVSLKGWLIYPGNKIGLEYRNKKLIHYRKFTVLAGFGWQFNENKPFIKADFLYNRFGIGTILGKSTYGVVFNYRL